MGNWQKDGLRGYVLRLDDNFTLWADAWPSWIVNMWIDGHPETLFSGGCRDVEEGKVMAVEAMKKFLRGSMASLKAIGVEV